MEYFNRAAIKEENDPINSILITRLLVLGFYMQNTNILVSSVSRYSNIVERFLILIFHICGNSEMKTYYNFRKFHSIMNELYSTRAVETPTQSCDGAVTKGSALKFLH